MTSHRPFRSLTRPLPPARKQRIADKAAALRTALALYELRKARAVSQAALAEKLAVGQPAVAKLERRADIYVSNLRRYVEALGGRLEITARFADGAVSLDLAEAAADDKGPGKRRGQGGGVSGK